MSDRWDDLVDELDAVCREHPRLEQAFWVVVTVLMFYVLGEATYTVFGLVRMVTGW
jgi:hypothetical protein